MSHQRTIFHYFHNVPNQVQANVSTFVPMEANFSFQPNPRLQFYAYPLEILIKILFSEIQSSSTRIHYSHTPKPSLIKPHQQRQPVLACKLQTNKHSENPNQQQNNTNRQPVDELEETGNTTLNYQTHQPTHVIASAGSDEGV